MTDLPLSNPKIPLGAGSIIAKGFAIYFKRFLLFFAISLIPSCVALFTAAPFAKSPTNGIFGIGRDLSQTIMALALIASVIFTISASVQLAYAPSPLRKTDLLERFKASITKIPWLVFITFILGIILALFITACVFALDKLDIPDLLRVAMVFAAFASMIWCLTALSVSAPAAALGRHGFRSLNYSLSLTKTYRWPIALILTVAFVFCFIFYMLFSGVFSGLLGILIFFLGSIPDDRVRYLGAAVFIPFVLSFATVPSVFSVIIYTRLLEIKEGVGMEKISDVFD